MLDYATPIGKGGQTDSLFTSLSTSAFVDDRLMWMTSGGGVRIACLPFVCDRQSRLHAVVRREGVSETECILTFR